MPSPRSPLRNRVEAFLFSVAHGIFRSLPPAAAEATGRRLALLYRLVDRRRRKLSETNLARAFPQKSAAEVKVLSKAVFAHFGALAADLVRSVDEPLEVLMARVHVIGEERARAALESGRGRFVLAAHIGNWELAAVIAAARGLPMTVIARPLDNPLLESRLRSFRERSGNKVVPKAEAAREILRVLRKGGTVGILADQRARPPDAVAVPFFGRPASTTSAVARFAEKTEALVLPAWCIRDGSGGWRFEFLEPLDIRALPETERTTEAFTARINRIVEEMVRRHPEQWLWLHNRWRLDDEGGPTT